MRKTRRLMFELSKDYLDISFAEVLALVQDEKAEKFENILVTKDSDHRKLAKRLSMTKAIYDFLFSCDEKNLENCINNFEWNKVISNDFWVRLRHSKRYKEADIADMIWDKLKKPKASIKSLNQIVLIFVKNKVFCGKLLAEPVRDYNTRKPHMRPEHSPTSLPPKIARAMINLTGIKKGAIIDPFCGVGGILIENGLMGLTGVGYEIDEKTFHKCRKNLEHYKIKYFHLHNEDSLKLAKDFDYVVTDLPYGRSSKLFQDREELYENFLRLLDAHLRKKAVVMYPSDSKFREKIRKYNLILENEFSIYVHRTLTRKIAVISRRR